jgi:hypothetical protein
MGVLILINKKDRRQNEGFIQGQEDMNEVATANRNIIERAEVAGVNPSPILEDIMDAVRSVNSSNPVGICTDSDVELRKRALIEKVQQFMSKYGITELEVGSYPDSYAMDGYTEVRLMLSSSGHLFEQYHDSRFNQIELSPYWLEQFYDSKRILYNLFEKLIKLTEMNKAKIKKIEELAKDFSLGTAET